jgi:hypothetical protein
MQTTVVARDEFLLNVQSAVTGLLPIVDEKRPYTDKKDLEDVLSRKIDWLSKGSVEGYHARDFEDLDETTRETLQRNVEAFLEVARKGGPKRPANPDQVDAALPPFLEVAAIARKLMLDEWLEAARGLIDQVAAWAEAEGWPTKRYHWKLTEPFLGTYELDRLVFGVMGSQMALIPVGRFMMTSEGAFDLSVMPTFDSVMVARGRPSKKWLIRPLPGEKKSRRWTRSAFVEASERLARMV